MTFQLSTLKLYNKSLVNLPSSKLLISTINAHSFNQAKKDILFAKALSESDILLPDGVSIILAKRLLTGEKLKKIAGADLFFYEMARLNQSKGSCLFIGSNELTLQLIYQRASIEYPCVKVFTYSPPFKPEFSDEDTERMINIVNKNNPEVLFIGMTAPKQEKWAYLNFDKLDVKHICCIGAVFDFYSRRINRAPEILIKYGLEWLYRLMKEPRRMWRRYLQGNAKFIWLVLKEKFIKDKN